MICEECGYEIESKEEHFLDRTLCYDCCYEAIVEAIDGLYFDKEWMKEYCGYGFKDTKINQGDLFSIILFILQENRNLRAENDFLLQQLERPLDDVYG